MSQVTQHPAQRHFRVSGLQAAIERGLDPALRIWVAHALAEEIEIATEVWKTTRDSFLNSYVADHAVAVAVRLIAASANCSSTWPGRPLTPTAPTR